MTKKKCVSKKSIKDTFIKHFPIIGIGASAGGLEAIEGFFSHMSSDGNMAFVIIQHLAPGYKSIMSSLLNKFTHMKIVEIKDGARIEPNTVYLNLPNKYVGIIHGTLHLIEQTETPGIKLPIDYFFRSLAEDQGERSICIILSGTGTDGTLGMKEIKRVGGMAMVQEEKQAKYDGMPRSAIDTGLVDYILPIEKMPEELQGYVKHPYLESQAKGISSREHFEKYLQKIFLLIRARNGHDFSDYKRGTTRRRIERRMAVHNFEKIKDYYRYLEKNAIEIDTLYKDMLIGVTNFFREADAFKVLKEKAVCRIVKNKAAESSIRIWIPGCATGEEAYSIAILFSETMQEMKKYCNVQIFATDIDADAIEYARAAVFPESIAADISPKRLKQFFIKEDHVFKVKKSIREMVVFSVQNLIKDPPFSKIDLICCRNVLIYMNVSLQKKIISLFYYVLNFDGFLFLGTSESLGEYTELFTPVNTKWKIFQHKRSVMERVLPFPRMPFYNGTIEHQVVEDKKATKIPGLREIAESLIIKDYAPPFVIINEKEEILYFHGDTERYLSPPAGEANFNVLKMVRSDLRYKLSMALHRAMKQKKTIKTEILQIKDHNESIQSVNIIVRPVTETNLAAGLFFVIFEQKEVYEKLIQMSKNETSVETIDPRVPVLEQELQSTRGYLQSTIEELETANEELKSANEELQSTNEELQSANEELETSKEELQSTNEELETVNAEHQNKINELAQSNNDLKNLFATTEIETIFLDTNFCIKRFAPPASTAINLRETDIGRPISEITTNIKYENLYNDIQYVLKKLQKKEIEVINKNGNWYSMRIFPYRTVDNIIDGIVISFVDITNLKKFEEMQKEMNKRFYTIFHEALDGIALIDAETGCIFECNSAFECQAGRKREKLNTMKLQHILSPDSVKSGEKLFAETKMKGVAGKNEIVFQKPTKTRVTTEVVGKLIKIQDKQYLQIVTREITERKQKEAALRHLATVVQDSNDAIIVYNLKGRITDWNRGAEKMYGYTKSEALRMNITKILPRDKKQEECELIEQVKTGKVIESAETKRITKDGSILDVWLTSTKITDDKGRVVGVATTERDITEKKQTEVKYKRIIGQLKKDLVKFKNK